MNKRRALLFAAAAFALAGGAAYAQQPAWTSKSVNLRAGPAREYPVVAVLGPRTPVTVFACVPDFRWCDVAVGPDRGWVYSGNLLYSYQDREVVLPGVAALVGIGIAAFIIDDYWHDHYVERWWYPQRRRWYRPAPIPPIRMQQPLRVQPAPHPQQRTQPQPRVQQPHEQRQPGARPDTGHGPAQRRKPDGQH